MPSKIIIFGQGAAALPQHLAQKGNFEGGFAAPKPPPRNSRYLNSVVRLSTEVTSYDAVDRCKKSKVSTPGHFFRRGADGLWHRPDAGHAGGRLS